jgi:hypothetical protein
MDYAKRHYREMQVSSGRLGSQRIEGLAECQVQKPPVGGNTGGAKYGKEGLEREKIREATVTV